MGDHFVILRFWEVRFMDREDIERLSLGESAAADVATGKPARMPVIGLPSHLHARVEGGQSGYQYRLERDGDVHKYSQDQFSGTPWAASAALRSLLNWDPL